MIKSEIKFVNERNNKPTAISAFWKPFSEKDIGKRDGDQYTQLVYRHDDTCKHVAQGFIIAQPGCPRGKPGEHEKQQGFRGNGGMLPAEPTMSTMTSDIISTTIVRIAVATVESVFLIPHFARIAVAPAKSAEPSANNTHIRSPPVICREAGAEIRRGFRLRL